jgi:hypothetical protein
VAQKWTKILFAVWATRQPYDEQLHIERLNDAPRAPISVKHCDVLVIGILTEISRGETGTCGSPDRLAYLAPIPTSPKVTEVRTHSNASRGADPMSTVRSSALDRRAERGKVLDEVSATIPRDAVTWNQVTK